MAEITKEERARLERALSETKGSKEAAARLLGMAPSTFRRKLQENEIETFHRKPHKSKIYVITSAQNATPAHKKSFRTLLGYCAHHKAELVIIPLRYRNPTSIWPQGDKNNQWWDRDLRPYLCDSRFDINSNLSVLGDIKTQPTAVDPLSGFDSISGDKSAIFGHTSVRLKTVPVVTGDMPKIICTTGAITVRNYTDTKSGKKGEFHHTLGATVVRVKNNRVFHIRQLNFTNDGRLVDLNEHWTQDGMTQASAPAVVLGDWHDFAVDPLVEKATFTAKNSLCNTLNPHTIVWHDALDFYSRNLHHDGNPFINLAKHRAGVDDVRAEIEKMVERVERLAGGRLSVFPYSNHPDMLRRWIHKADWKQDPKNAAFYLETALAMVESTQMRGHKSHTIDPFAHWCLKFAKRPDLFRFLKPNDDFRISGISIDMHGHIGPNGARGSVKSFSKLAVKSITGHGHGAEIMHGAYRVGTSSVYDQEYVGGPSSWMQTHCLIYPDTGKRSLINVINGECF